MSRKYFKPSETPKKNFNLKAQKWLNANRYKFVSDLLKSFLFASGWKLKINLRCATKKPY